MTIRQLPPVVVNRIAAGEVIERPAGVGQGAGRERDRRRRPAASRSSLRDGGQALIAVVDDGCGMDAGRAGAGGRAPRHLEARPTTTLFRITALGFRGEALPSIGAVSRLRITSRPPAR